MIDSLENLINFEAFIRIFVLLLIVYTINNIKFLKISIKSNKCVFLYFITLIFSLIFCLAFILLNDLLYILILNCLLLVYFCNKLLYTVEDYLFQIILFCTSLKYIFGFNEQIYFFLLNLIILHSFCSSGIEKAFDLSWRKGVGFYFFSSLPWTSHLNLHSLINKHISVLFNYYIVILEIFAIILFFNSYTTFFVLLNLNLFFISLIYPFRLDLIGYVGFLVSIYSINILSFNDALDSNIIFGDTYYIGAFIIVCSLLNTTIQIMNILVLGPFKNFQPGYKYYINGKDINNKIHNKYFKNIDYIYKKLYINLQKLTFKIESYNLFSTNHFYPLFTYQCIFKNSNDEIVYELPLFSNKGKPLNLISGIFQSRNMEATLYMVSNLTSRYNSLGSTYANWFNNFFELVLNKSKLSNVSTIHIIVNPIKYKMPFSRKINQSITGFEILSKKVNGFLCFTPFKYDFEPLYLNEKNYITSEQKVVV